MRRILISLAALLSATVGQASTPIEEGFAGALRGCETWVLDPASWVDGLEPFKAKVELGAMMGKVATIDEISLPPAAMRRANHYWRINASADSGYTLVVSDQLPMCHITGGGRSDLRQAITATLSSPEFAQRWKKVGERTNKGLISAEYRSVEDSKFTITISLPDASSWSLDRLQLIATAQFKLST